MSKTEQKTGKKASGLANSGGYLLAALLAFLFVATAAASGDLSGRWKIVYAVESGSPDDGLAEGSVARWSEKDSTLQGRATLGNRGEGYLIGYCMESSFRAAISFRHNPTMFVEITGSRTDGELRGSFTATTSKGDFWKGTFRAIQLTTGTGEIINPTPGSIP